MSTRRLQVRWHILLRHCLPAAVLACGTALAAAPGAGPTAWSGDLRPITAEQWNAQRAAHLLERAGFGATPEEIARFAAMTPQQAVATLVRPQAVDNSHLPPFDASGIHEAGLEPFPASRPATTEAAQQHGEALGVAVKPEGNRRLQPVVNKFFYWLRASRLETHRVAYWWANRMLLTHRPLEEKMALFWHGHFATHEDKVRDARKMLQQLELFEARGLGNFRDLMIGVAQGPAMLAFLDAGVNVKGAPNENFAREIMEMFTMGVGNYSERDIREAARAFTGWNSRDLRFVIDDAKHDDGEKEVLGRRGRFDGVQVIDIVLAQPVTAEYLAGRIYRFMARDEITPQLRRQLGAVLRDNHYEIAPLLETIFLSRDFYGPDVVGNRIKSPVELVVSTYRKLGLTEVPGVPDFNDVTGALGQHLLYPPTVAGWAYGRSWITPGLLMERGNFARDVLFPDFTALPTDRFPTLATGLEVRAVHERISRGLDITAATVPEGKDMAGGDAMAMSNRMSDRDEEFNTRYGSYRGWQKAVEVVKPIPRTMARVDLSGIVVASGGQTTADAVDVLARRFLSTPVSASQRSAWTDFLTRELGTDRIARAATYMEDGLRMLLHLMLASPDYQLG
ncbi:DUF1800 domain-containing protein [Methylibium sp.]|uniref:DUF1800 domain-containing protein n=1 Tax=Methylibium sp. TaxID=2067992 RepID=UPI003D1081AE